MASDYESARDEVLHIHRPEPRKFAHFEAHCVSDDQRAVASERLARMRQNIPGISN